MADQDRARWDSRYASRTSEPAGPPAVFAAYQEYFPRAGSAVDVACGQGGASVWLALRGLTVRGIDISPVAISRARALAVASEVTARCQFQVCDLDAGLPSGPPADVILCHRFRDPRLDATIVGRLAPGGLLALSALSEVGAQPGPFRTAPGELLRSFDGLEVIAASEGDGEAWILARRPH